MKLIRIMLSAVCLSIGLGFTSHCAEWQQDSKGWYYTKDDGSFIKGDWLKEENNWYYFDEDGYMLTGWVKNNNNWYYMDEDGVMLSNTTKDGFDLAFDGSMLKYTYHQNDFKITDVQKRILNKAIASLVDWHVDVKGLGQNAVYKKEDFKSNRVGILFNVLRNIDSHELFKTKQSFVSETDSDFVYSAVSVDEALYVLNGLYACDFTKEELIEDIKLTRNTGRGFFTFDDCSYISKEGIFVGNPIPEVVMEKYDLKDGYLRAYGEVSASAYDKNTGKKESKTYKLTVGFEQNPAAVGTFTLDYIALK